MQRFPLACNRSPRRRLAYVVVSTAVLTGRTLRSFAAVPGLAWPDTRLWLRDAAAGNTVASKHRPARAQLAFDAYSRPVAGTREVRLGDCRFYAFSHPRLGAEHFVIWHRLSEIRAEAEAWLAAEAEDASERPLAWHVPAETDFKVTRAHDRQPLTAAVWNWRKLDEKDPDRYWADGAGNEWMYWDSFWLPGEPAELAADTPAFADAAGRMLAPLELGPPVASKNGETARRETRKPIIDTSSPVASTATASAMKDRAYAIVYEYNVWGSDVSRSGTGSDFWSPEARLAVTALSAVVDRFGLRSVLDCACGDGTWMVPFFVANRPEIKYCGVDIVPEVIERNRQNHPSLEFFCVDVAVAPVPVQMDLVFSKETLNHMSLDDACNALESFRDSGAKYLLTNVHEGAVNEDGQVKNCFTTYVKYDYSLPPFNLRKIWSVIEYQGWNTSYTVFDLQG